MHKLLINSQNIKLGNIAGEVYKHITDDTVHVTAEQKDKINKVVDNCNDNFNKINSQIQSINLDLLNCAKVKDIPTKLSQLKNDCNFITDIPSYYTTEEEVKLLIKDSISEISDENISEIEELIKTLTNLVNQNVVSIEDVKLLSNNNYNNIETLKVDVKTLQDRVQQIQNNITSIEDRITDIEDGSSSGGDYNLPIASASTLGGVKIGTGISIEDDGTISTSFDIGDIDTDVVIAALKEWVKENYITKSDNDNTEHKLWVGYNDKSESSVQNNNGVITRSVKSKDFISNSFSGTGFYLGESSPSLNSEFGSGSMLEVDNVSVRKKINFNTLEIRKVSQIGGTLVMSSASGTLTDVEYIGEYSGINDCYKCYLKTDDGTILTTNDFISGDLIRCLTFNIKSEIDSEYKNKYYNAQVIYSGKDDGDYIVIGNFDASHHDVPSKDDVIVQMGHVDDGNENRSNLIILSSTDNNSPSIMMYSHVHDYDFKNAQIQSIISPESVQFRSNSFKLISGTSSHPVAVDRGEWSENETYYYWDRVSYNGSLWLCVYNNELGCTNIAPGSEGSGQYWLLLVSKGENGQDGDVSGVYQILLSDQNLFTYYDENTGTYTPNLKGTTISVSVYKGNKLITPSGYNITTEVPSGTITMGLPIQGSQTTNLTIGNITIQPNNSAKINILARITDEENEVTLQSSVTVMCLDSPVQEDSYNCLVSGQGLYLSFDVNTNSEGKINLIYLPELIKASATVYLGDTLVTEVNKITDLSELKSQLESNSQKVNIFAEYETDQEIKGILNFDTENVVEGSSATFSLNDFGFTNNKIESVLVDSEKELYYPCTSGNIKVSIWFPGNTTTSSPNYKQVLDVKLTLTGTTSWFKVDSNEFQSVQGKITDLGAQYTAISQTVDEVELSLNTVEGTVGTLGTKLDELDDTVNSWVGINKDDLKLAGLYVNYDQGELTGSIDIIADKFLLYNQEYSTTSGSSGLKYMWYNQDSHILNMSNVDIVGGTIGGYNIENNKIYSSSTSGTINIDADSIELKSKSTINDEFSNPYPVSQIRISSSYKEDLGVSLGGHVYSSLLVRAQHSGTNGIHTGIFIDAAKTDNIDMYGIASYLPSSLYGIQNYGGEQYLWSPLTNNETISLNIRKSSKYIYYGNSNISITLPTPRTNYIDSNTIQIFVATQSNVTVNGSGCKIMYSKYNSVVNNSSTEKATSIGLNYWGIYTFVYIGPIIGDGSNYWVCTYNSEVFK